MASEDFAAAQLGYLHEKEVSDIATDVVIESETVPVDKAAPCEESVCAEQILTDEEHESAGQSSSVRCVREARLEEESQLNKSACTCCEKCSADKKTRVFMRLDDFCDDPDAIHYYTGLLNYKNCMLVLNTLCPEAYDLDLIYTHSQVVKIPVQDQFFLTMIKWRRSTPDFELSRLFGCSTGTVSNVFMTWIYFMAEMWSMQHTWPEEDLIEYFMPAAFKEKHSATRVIVDGTEFGIAKPNNARSQQASFSHYKNRCTLKGLLGPTPGGLLSFC